jgi:hypothetical protein
MIPQGLYAEKSNGRSRKQVFCTLCASSKDSMSRKDNGKVVEVRGKQAEGSHQSDGNGAC